MESASTGRLKPITAARRRFSSSSSLSCVSGVLLNPAVRYSLTPVSASAELVGARPQCPQKVAWSGNSVAQNSQYRISYVLALKKTIYYFNERNRHLQGSIIPKTQSFYSYRSAHDPLCVTSQPRPVHAVPHPHPSASALHTYPVCCSG